MDTLIPSLLGWAVLLPLISFGIIFVVGPKMGKAGSLAAYLACFAIVVAFLLSATSAGLWLSQHPILAEDEHGHDAAPVHGGVSEPSGDPAADHASEEGSSHDATAGHAAAAEDPHGAHDEEHAGIAGAADEHSHGHGKLPVQTGNWYTLGTFGKLELTIGYYVDALTIAMFCMVTLIASCIHFYAMGYMHEELHDVTDHEITLRDGSHLHRPGRYSRFFQYLSLFSFSMLGLVVAGNILMTFVFWELVGICSYFLIGFYVERQSASTAANKAFIVNRIGDFGMIIGLMALWGSLGTFAFGDIDGKAGIFSQVRPPENGYALVVPEGMQRFAAAQAGAASLEGAAEDAPAGGYGYGLLFVAGVGIFCGCVGKSAQFPLHVWLPDAMEGPTPVSALVHSATMVAAGVYLVARFYPVFTPDVLLVICVVGGITLFLAATIAITATDIKRVLAYSTVSQLGYMMLALGLGGWLAGVLHLFTHAFFKSLLFLCSGSVIHAVHTNEMPEMGGLRHKMPWTAYTMLVGCLAIAGAGIPFVIGLSGYHSKDAILEHALLFRQVNSGIGGLFFFAAAGGAAITAFYMFRLWYLTFAGKPRDPHRYEHAHESPPVMYVPLVILAIFGIGLAWNPDEAVLGAALTAVIALIAHFAWRARRPESDASWFPRWVGWPVGIAVLVAVLWVTVFQSVPLARLLDEQARPAGTLAGGTGTYASMVWPNEHDSHVPEIKTPATLIAFGTAFGGFLLATVFYGWRLLDPAEAARQFRPLYRFLLNKWWFDELYDFLFVRPVLLLSHIVARFDRRWIDGLVDGSARLMQWLASTWELIVDRGIVDGFVNRLAAWTYAFGLSLRGIQTGQLRQYVLFIVIGTIAVFVVATFFWGYSFAS